MSLRTIGEAKVRTNGTKNRINRKAIDRLREATLSTMERLENRRMLNAAVQNVQQTFQQGATPLAPIPGETYYVSGSTTSQWNQASAVTPAVAPRTVAGEPSTDLVLNVSPFIDNYTSSDCCEGAGGSVNLMTNGLTQDQTGAAPNATSPAIGDGGVSDPSNNVDVLSNLNNGWNMAYKLGTAGGASQSATGYDLNEIDVISGHQDYRVQIRGVDIQVQYVGSTDWVTITNGTSFSFNVDGSGTTLTRGSAQMAIGNDSSFSTPMARNVANVKFIATSDVTWFRELVVMGAPTPTTFVGSSTGPTAVASVNATFNVINNASQINVTWPSGSNELYYKILRGSSASGSPPAQGAFTVVGTAQPGTTAFTDTSLIPATTYYYEIASFNSFNGGTTVFSPPSNGAATPPPNIEAHYYNQAYWEGPVNVATTGLAVNANNGSGPWVPGIRSSNNGAVYTGKVITPATGTGVFTFVSNTDDDGFLYVDGVLVSEDPNYHGQRDAGLTYDINGNANGQDTPIFLQGNTAYDFVYIAHNSGGGSGAHLEWITPTMGAGASPVLVPSSSLTAISDPPAQPTGLTVTDSTISNKVVDFTFTANNNAVVHYILQRSSDGGNTWTTVNQIDPVTNNAATVYGGYPVTSGITATVNSIVNATVSIQDASPAPGATYQYRVAAVNYDGLSSTTLANPVAIPTISAVADLANPTAAPTATTAADAAGLAASTYFVKYTWVNSVNGETAGSTELTQAIAAASDLIVSVPVAPAGTLQTKVYIGSATGKERFANTVASGGTLTIKQLPPGNAAAVPTTSSAGLAAGNYFIEYTWVSSGNTGETLPVAEQTFSLASLADISITVPANPGGTSGANVYVSNSSGGELLAGSVAGGGTLLLKALPAPWSIPGRSSPVNVGSLVEYPGVNPPPIGFPAPNFNSTFVPSSGVAVTTPASTFATGDNGTLGNHNTNVVALEARNYNYEEVNQTASAAFNNNGSSELISAPFIFTTATPTEYTATLTDQAFNGFTGLFGGAIDQDLGQVLLSDLGSTPAQNSPDGSNGHIVPGLPDVDRLHSESTDSVFTGQIVPAISGTYTLISNTDDSGFWWVNGTLVSQDPGGHGQRDSGTVTPVVLSAGTAYNFVFIQENVGGGAGYHAEWIEPPVQSNQTAQSGASTDPSGATIQLNGSASGTDGAYVGYTIFLTSGTGSGQNGVITQYFGGNKQATVLVEANNNASNWGTTPDSSTHYSIAYKAAVPLYDTGQFNNGGLQGADYGGMEKYMEIPHFETTNFGNGVVNDPVVNFNSPNSSAAQSVTIASLDPVKGATITWKDQSASTLWFEIQRSSNGGTSWTSIANTPFGIGTVYTDATAANAYNNAAVSYSYRIRGVNFDAAGPWSAVASTTNLTLPTPTMGQIIHGAAGTAGFTFGGESVSSTGLELEQATLSGGVLSAFTDSTPQLLPNNTFDFQLTGLTAATTYVFEVRNDGGANAANSPFSATQTFIPSAGVNESFGTPGSGVGGFPANPPVGDLRFNGNTQLTGSGIPAAANPTVPATITSVSDLANPTAALSFSQSSDLANPTAAPTLGSTRDPLLNGLIGDNTYYVEYTWVNAANGETIHSPEANIAIIPSSDIFVTLPTAPAGAVKTNVYLANASGAEQFSASLSSSANPSILTITQYPATNAAAAPTTSTAGLAAGTYFVEYTWLNAAGGETAASGQFNATITANNSDLTVTVPASPAGTPAAKANIYLSNASGQEVFAGSTGANSTLKILTVPTSTTKPPAVNGAGMAPGTYFIQYNWTSQEPGAGQTAGSPEQTFTLTSQGDILVNVPANTTDPGAANSANVFMSTTSGKETLFGSVGGGGTATVQVLPSSSASAVPTSSGTTQYFTPASALQLNNNTNGQAASTFNTGENIAGFSTSFDFQFTGDEGADGLAFMIQPVAQNLNSQGGGSFGVGPGHSVAVGFNLYNGVTQTGIGTGTGNIAENSVPGSSNLNFHSGTDVYECTLTYNDTTKVLTEVVTDLTKTAAGQTATFSTTYNVDITGIVGMPAAFVGFTGASGGAHSEKDILDWSFTGGPGAGIVSGDVINGTAINDTITLSADTNPAFMDWSLNGGPVTQVSINDPAGLTINGNGGTDTINVSAGTTLTNLTNLNGKFVINGLPALTAGQTVNIGQSTVDIAYSGASPVAAIAGYIKSGQIKSTAIAANPGTGIGYADSADHVVVGQPANTVQVEFTVLGDTNLDGTVNFTDLVALAQHYNSTTAVWDQGDFNGDGTVNFTDLVALAQNYNKSRPAGSFAVSNSSLANLTPSVTMDTSSTASSGKSKHNKKHHHHG